MNKKGTTMVEATIVFPIAIAAIIVVIYILIHLYNQVSIQSNMHIALTAEAGKRSDTVESKIKYSAAFPVYEKKSTLVKSVYYKGTTSFQKRGILTERIDKTLEGNYFVVNGKETVRYFDLVKRGSSE